MKRGNGDITAMYDYWKHNSLSAYNMPLYIPRRLNFADGIVVRAFMTLLARLDVL